MGDEIPLTRDDIGVPGLTYFDLRNDLPDVLEVDLSDQDTYHLSSERLDGYGNMHVRLGLSHEIYRTEERGASKRLHEGFIRGAIPQILRPGHLHSRLLNQFAAVGIQHRSRGDRGGDFQQLAELEPVGLRQSRGHDVWRLRGRPQRLLDVLHELLDLEGGPLCHLPLQYPDALDALTVAEEELDRTAGEESATHQDEGDEERPPQQSATTLASWRGATDLGSS